ncbi:hypothetical protein [Candidatus Methanomassiliicoccus intestinalis]|jgi:hypothetical protein|uniref:Uncharacterized protein n=1 Tax=Candidatus Methanomassiliicoccus intestinalis TaxID=1406512 RepID=A0A8J8PEJ8_9ARCH|nr:MAG: hypothetical protein A3207_04765 [Candidatus Methanomassiliicoccus intestinalis]
MVVKSKRGRRRYIVFETTEKISEDELLCSLRSYSENAGIPVPKVIQFNGNKGIVRVNGTNIDKARALMNNKDFKTLLTSGTLLTIRERYFKPCEKRN